MADSGAPVELQYPGLKHGRDPLCAPKEIERGVLRPRRSPPFGRSPHEYLNWILKAQNHRPNEPCRDLNERVGDASNFEGGREMIDPKCSRITWLTRLHHEGNVVKRNWEFS